LGKNGSLGEAYFIKLYLQHTGCFRSRLYHDYLKIISKAFVEEKYDSALFEIEILLQYLAIKSYPLNLKLS
jgi:hypothetical protein